jgi:hypothetical protein
MAFPRSPVSPRNYLRPSEDSGNNGLEVSPDNECLLFAPIYAAACPGGAEMRGSTSMRLSCHVGTGESSITRAMASVVGHCT